jgi:hypothetical protein
MSEHPGEKLEVVVSNPTLKRGVRRRSLTETAQVTCGVCEQDVGVATSLVIEVVKAPRRKPDGRKTGGTRAWVCLYCLSRGKVTELIRS